MDEVTVLQRLLKPYEKYICLCIRNRTTSGTRALPNCPDIERGHLCQTYAYLITQLTAISLVFEWVLYYCIVCYS